MGTKIFAAALLGLLIASPAAAGVQTPAQALATDAAEYAQLFDVPLAEAMTRLRAQEASVAATDRIAATYGDRLAGIAIEHKPQYRVVVLLTGDVPVPDSEIRAGGMKVPVVFRTGAAATRDEVVASIEKNQAAIRAALPHPPALAADSRTGEMVVMVFGGDSDALGSEALRAQFAEMTGVPVRIEAIDRVAVDLAIEGGARVEGLVEGKRYYCTTGFVVTDGVGTGVVTAAHCPDALDYLDAANTRTPLTYAGQWGWGYRDVQLHTSEERLEPVFYADTAKSAARTVRTWRNRTSTRAGDVVCHRGETTGYSCAEVEYVDFAPAGDLCGGACLPRWVAVNGPQCKGGDSGAPVFLGTTAFGIVKGGNYLPDRSCRFYYYMSTDYLPDGWTLLHR